MGDCFEDDYMVRVDLLIYPFFRLTQQEYKDAERTFIFYTTFHFFILFYSGIIFLYFILLFNIFMSTAFAANIMSLNNGLLLFYHIRAEAKLGHL